MPRRSPAPIGLLLAAATLLGFTATANAQSASRAVTVRFAGVVGDRPFSCGTSYDGIGTTASTIQAADFRFYVSHVRLLRAGGDAVDVALTQDGRWQVDDVALIDFEDRTGACSNGTEPTRTVIEGMVPAGDYTGVAFDLGLPFDRNHRDPASQPSPLNLSRLFWSWNAGYKFLRLDLRTTGMPQGWVVHLGSTGCDAATATSEPRACRQPNLVPVSLPGFDPARDVIEFDIQALLSGNNVDVNQAQALGCMSGQADPECVPLFTQLGLAIGDVSAGTQRVFRTRRAMPATGSR